jgi:hypothetical protein
MIRGFIGDTMGKASISIFTAVLAVLLVSSGIAFAATSGSYDTTGTDSGNTGMNTDTQGTTADTGVTTTGSARTATQGSVATGNNTNGTQTAGARTVGTTSTTTGSDSQRNARTYSMSENRQVAEGWLASRGDYVLVDSEHYDVSQDIYVFVYAHDDAADTQRNARTTVGNSDNTFENDTVNDQGTTVMRSSSQGTATRRNARLDNEDMLYVIVTNGQVMGVIAEDSLMYRPVSNDARNARDVEGGFITVDRNSNMGSTTMRSARATSTDDEDDSDTMSSSSNTAPWNNIGADDSADDDSDEDDSDNDTTSTSSAPWNNLND